MGETLRCPNCSQIITKETTKADVKTVCDAWRYTLHRFHAPRDLIHGEDIEIARQIQQKGMSNVLLSFRGACVEPKTKDFDPSNYLSLNRIFSQKNFDRLVTLGAQDKSRKEMKAKKKAQTERQLKDSLTIAPIDHRELVASPERKAEIQTMMKGIFEKLE